MKRKKKKSVKFIDKQNSLINAFIKMGKEHKVMRLKKLNLKTKETSIKNRKDLNKVINEIVNFKEYILSIDGFLFFIANIWRIDELMFRHKLMYEIQDLESYISSEYVQKRMKKLTNRQLAIKYLFRKNFNEKWEIQNELEKRFDMLEKKYIDDLCNDIITVMFIDWLFEFIRRV